MTENRRNGITILALLLSLCLHSLAAETIRGQVIDSLTAEGGPVTFGIYDLVKISEKNLSEFQTGMELRIDIPTELRAYRNSFALLLYKRISPMPEPARFNYSATRHFMRLLPSRASTYIHIPYRDDYEVNAGPFTDVVPVRIDNTDLPLVLVISPVVKGIPDEAIKHKLQVSVKPVLNNLGAIKFQFPSISPDEENEKIQVLLNGKYLDIQSRHVLQAGYYDLRAISSHAHPVERSVEIIRGEETVANLVFDYGPPEITVLVPQGFRAFVDDTEISPENGLYTQQIEPGTHKIQYLSENLEYSENFTVIGADKLRINLNVNIKISNSMQEDKQ